MLKRLMPKSDEFFDAFDAQCAVTVEGAKMLHALLVDYRDVAVRVQALREVEHRGDDVTHAAFNRLHKEFITPFDRAQIHTLLSRIDDVLDLTNAAAARLHYYEIETTQPDAAELARLLVLSTEKVQEVVAALRLIKKPDQILAGCKDIKRLESQTDEALRAGMGRLFKSGVDTLTIIKWKEIYDLIETATDKCNGVANVIEGVVLEHS
ncbi:DUF47 domain-containing protein [Stigmatella aurantiaca]|uniref:Conserved uncharacterized protein n=1 Tax=Stigmatella aurantiaca (strain DW4/3-1) TaxID=378806 RepID=Q08QU5_STIAD|nr:DUF47 family protein [Stigmatella aurantiaca]ADO74783.1 conserved uncharacterized protein [Stigmatella aurantiaca DW4/3-1]EAU62855.1 hypothetical protein STIAU_8439 [Stigmatella aurantiaca DW4/3-1]